MSASGTAVGNREVAVGPGRVGHPDQVPRSFRVAPDLEISRSTVVVGHFDQTSRRLFQQSATTRRVPSVPPDRPVPIWSRFSENFEEILWPAPGRG